MTVACAYLTKFPKTKSIHSSQSLIPYLYFQIRIIILYINTTRVSVHREGNLVQKKDHDYIRVFNKQTLQNKINPFISITNSLPLLSNSTTFSQPEYLETNNQTKLYCMHLEDTRTSAIILSLSRRGEDRKREDEL